MSHIHGISGSTKYLLNGTRPVNGKSFGTLDEMQHFYDHYNEILADTRTTVARREDETIAGLGREEARLDAELKEGIARQTQIVDKEIGAFDHMRYAADGILPRIGFSAKYWIAVALRNHHINSPYSGLSVKLDHVRYDKRHRAEYRQATIDRECNTITSSYTFLKNNESFLAGAWGEETAIRALADLPDEFHVINDVNLRFERALRWSVTQEYIKTCQIDHIVAGPTGIFLLETKNWTSANLVANSDALIHQVRRSNYALRRFVQQYYNYWELPYVRNVVISTNQKTGAVQNLDKYIDISSPAGICNYITRKKPELSKDAVDKFIRVVTRPQYSRPRF
jgi:Nuclease-related domain.